MELDVGPLGDPVLDRELPKDSNLPVPISSIKEEDDKIDVISVTDAPIRIYSVSLYI